jgi:hypothetical protein
MNANFLPLHPYVILGMVAMVSAEFQGNVLLRGNFIGFFLAMAVVYAPLSAIAWTIGKYVGSKHADMWFYAVGGLFGLVFIEWYLIGFYPGSGKSGIHAAMFTNWAAVFTIPRLFGAVPTDATLVVQRKVEQTVIVYSLGAPLLVLALPIPKGGSVAILMSIYSIRLSFLFAPWLVETPRARRLFKRFNLFLVAATVINVLVW